MLVALALGATGVVARQGHRGGGAAVAVPEPCPSGTFADPRRLNSIAKKIRLALPEWQKPESVVCFGGAESMLVPPDRLVVGDLGAATDDEVAGTLAHLASHERSRGIFALPLHPPGDCPAWASGVMEEERRARRLENRVRRALGHREVVSTETLPEGYLARCRAGPSAVPAAPIPN